MRQSGFRVLPLFALMLASPALAAPAAGPQSLDQYPSFIEFTSTGSDGSLKILRCGYLPSADGKTVTVDPDFQELTVQNQGRGTNTRLQHIDNVVISTSPAPEGNYGLYLQMLTPDNTVIGRICMNDATTDTISNCTSAPVKLPVDEMKLQDRKLGLQCVDLLTQGASQINPGLADAKKTEAFKATLRQKVATLSETK